MPDLPIRLARTAVSYLPSASLLGLRSIGDLPKRLRRRPHEPDFELFGAFDGTDATFVDIGANRGQSIDSIRCFAPAGRIIAFEPNQLLAAHLKARYGTREVTVHNVGLGAQHGTLELHTPGYGHTLYDTRAGVTRDSVASFLSSEHFFAYRGTRAKVVRHDVQIRTLDSFGLSPTAVKIDVEGGDFDVIHGARATLAEHLPLLMIEYPASKTADALMGLGYQPRVFRDRRLEVDTGESLNTIFVAEKHRTALDKHGFRCA